MDRMFPLSVQQMAEDLQAIEKSGWDGSQLMELIAETQIESDSNQVDSDDILASLSTREKVQRYLQNHSDGVDGSGICTEALQVSARMAELYVQLINSVLPQAESQLQSIRDNTIKIKHFLEDSLQPLPPSILQCIDTEESLRAELPYDANEKLIDASEPIQGVEATATSLPELAHNEDIGDAEWGDESIL